MNRDYPIQNILTHSYCESIEDLVTITDEDIPDICYQTHTKALESLSKGHQNIILAFIAFFEYKFYDNDPIGDDCVQITNDKFYEFHIMDYKDLWNLYKSGIATPLTTPTTSSSKLYSIVDNSNISIKRNPNTTGLYIVKPFCGNTKKVISVTPEEKFVRITQAIMTGRGQGRKGGLDVSRVYPGHNPNIMGRHRNTQFPDDRGDKAYKPGIGNTQCTKFPLTDPFNLNPPCSILYVNTMAYPDYCRKIEMRVNMASFHTKRSTNLKSPT